MVEDLDTLHVGGTERAINYFGKITTEEFFHSVEHERTNGDENAAANLDTLSSAAHNIVATKTINRSDTIIVIY